MPVSGKRPAEEPADPAPHLPLPPATPALVLPNALTSSQGAPVRNAQFSAASQGCLGSFLGLSRQLLRAVSATPQGCLGNSSGLSRQLLRAVSAASQGCLGSFSRLPRQLSRLSRQLSRLSRQLPRRLSRQLSGLRAVSGARKAVSAALKAVSAAPRAVSAALRAVSAALGFLAEKKKKKGKWLASKDSQRHRDRWNFRWWSELGRGNPGGGSKAAQTVQQEWSGPRPGGLTLRLRDSWGTEVRGW
jgi:hypothetical protein